MAKTSTSRGRDGQAAGRGDGEARADSGTKSTVEGGQIQRITHPPTPAMEQGGPCSFPSETGAALCLTKAQGETCYCVAQGCPCPSHFRPSETGATVLQVLQVPIFYFH